MIFGPDCRFYKQNIAKLLKSASTENRKSQSAENSNISVQRVLKSIKTIGSATFLKTPGGTSAWLLSNQ